MSNMSFESELLGSVFFRDARGGGTHPPHRTYKGTTGTSLIQSVPGSRCSISSGPRGPMSNQSWVAGSNQSCASRTMRGLPDNHWIKCEPPDDACERTMSGSHKRNRCGTPEGLAQSRLSSLLSLLLASYDEVPKLLPRAPMLGSGSRK